MNNFIIRQAIGPGCYPAYSNVSYAIKMFDFCRSKCWGSSDDYLTNMRSNGWSVKNIEQYSSFILELIK